LDQLGLNLGYLLLQIFNFFILFVILRVWVYKPILGLLDKRRQNIAQGLEDARVAAEARANAEKGQYKNVEFRLGEIENLPIADNTADVIISNCVINLSPNKSRVFQEAFRILKPGGRLAISDVVATVELPEAMRNDAGLIAGCMGNASLIEDLEAMIREAGFMEVRIQPKDESKDFIRDWAPDHNVTDYVVSASIEAVKPAARNSCC
jgi:SAM-dependent methyltransferase